MTRSAPRASSPRPRPALLALLVLLLAGSARAGEAPVPAHAEPEGEAAARAAERARAALAPFQRALQRALQEGLAEGPAEAITVCRDRAPALAAEASGEGVRVGRTSHRLRNPANAPAPWMEPLLDHYLERPAERAPRTVRLGPERFGYVEPIETRPLCLACHGSDLDPAVEARLDALYPRDEARGFEVGELRGLFWVTLPAPE